MCAFAIGLYIYLQLYCLISYDVSAHIMSTEIRTITTRPYGNATMSSAKWKSAVTHQNNRKLYISLFYLNFNNNNIFILYRKEPEQTLI